MTTPSEEFTQAADLIRDRAAKTAPGPWDFEDSSEDVEGAIYQRLTGEEIAFARWPTLDIQDANGRWIALLNPDVAPHLEALLRAEAERISWATSWDEVADIPAKHLAQTLLSVKNTPEKTS